ncbi:MAG: DUF5686 and carboxypeptidase regulatory-like domain-containing protein [Mangrovibacterium sp.]
MKIQLVIIFSLLHSLAMAQTLSGRIINQRNEPIAHANIFVSELGKGATSNAEGFYQISLPEGEWEIMFRYMGYQSHSESINIMRANIRKDIQLSPQILMLPEVMVLGTGEDPAYYIMRHAISRAPYYREQVGEYDCKVYLKGSGHMYKIPFFFRKKMKEEGIELNRTYSSESISKIHFEQPDQITHEVEAVRTSVLDESFNNITMPMVSLSLYDNWELQADEYSATVISPLDKSSFSNYRFRLVGSFTDQGHLVNKIEVVPKVKGKNRFEGTISIVDEIWCIHSAELKFSVPFVDVEMKQIYSLVDEAVWMPTSQIYQVDGGLMGFAGKANYVASASDYRVKLNPHINHALFQQARTERKQEAAVLDSMASSSSKAEQKIKVLQAEETLSNSEMRQLQRNIERETKRNSPPASLEIKEPYVLVEAKANNDSAFWSEMRPVPLTSTESQSFTARNEAAEKYRPKQANDSIRNKENAPWININPFYYNTVDGYKPEVSLEYFKCDTLGRRIAADATFAAGVETENFYGSLSSTFIWNGFRREGGRIYVGRNSVDFKGEKSINEILNSTYTLFFENNSWKLYDRHCIQLSYFTDLSNSLRLHTQFDYSQRNPMQNQTTFTFIDWSDRQIEENKLPLPGMEAWQEEQNSSATFFVQLTYTPEQFYEISEGRKIVRDSRFPTFELSYQQSLSSFFNTDAKFNLLKLGIQHRVDVGVNDVVRYHIQAGGFPNREQIYAPDFYFAQSNDEYLEYGSSWDQFNAAPYYMLFSEKLFAELHMQLLSDKILLKRLPLLNRTVLNESLRMHHFSSEQVQNYFELGYGISHLMLHLSVNYGLANWSDNYWSLRLGVSF